PCSNLFVLPATRRQSHPCNAFLPFSVPHQFCASLPHALRGADAEIPEQVHMQTGSSNFYQRLVGIVSPTSLLPPCFGAVHLAQAESQCTARELSPAELQAKRLAEAARNLLAVLPMF